MKYRTKIPAVGDIKIIRRFAWFPKMCNDGYTVRLGWYREIYKYGDYISTPVVTGGVVLPGGIKCTGWALERTESGYNPRN